MASAILSFEGAIAVRNGCFCAHPYIQRLLRLSEAESLQHRDEINKGIRSNVPGMIRISFGLYNTKAEIDKFFVLVEKIIQGKYKGEYSIDSRSGEAYPKNYRFPVLKGF